MVTKILFIMAFVGFGLIGILLLTGHWGFAIRIANYIYLYLLVGIYVQK